jgi:thiamine biosynthesis lipoprotein ApbE
VATSTSLLRTWGEQGDRRHHILDPSTGDSTRSNVEFVSVIAGQAWVAEAHAKSIMVGGIRTLDALEEQDLAALAVDTLGRVHTTPNFSLFTGGLEPSCQGAST